MRTETQRDFVPAALAVAGTVLLSAVFLDRFRPALRILVETAPPSVAAVIVLAAVIGCGHAARFRRLSDRVAAGFALFGTLCAAAAMIDTRIVVPLTVVAAAWGAFVLGREGWGTGALARPPLLLVVPALLAFAFAIAPVNSPDELVYKLAIPHAWLLHGRMIELPLASNSYLVMALQGTSMAAMALGGGIAAKLASFALWLAAVAIVRRVGGGLAAVVVAWTPALMIIAGWAWSEWGVVALLVLSYERWTEEDVDGAAIALGLAVASKYTALPWLLAYGVLLLLRRRRALLRTAILVAAFGGFFYVRNAVWTGSPFAPLFLPDAPAVQGYRGNGWEGLVHGVDVFDARVADESLGILLPLAAITGLFAWRRRRDLVLLGAIQMPILLTIAPGSRNIVNGVVPLALAGAALLTERALWSAAVRVVMGVVMGVALGAQLILTVFTLESYEVVPYLAGKEDARQYLDRTRTFMKPYSWIARETPPNARILLLGENRTFYLDREFVAATNLDGPRIADWLSAFPNVEALRAGLRKERISYIVIHLPWYRMGTAPLGTLEKEYVLQVPPRTQAVLMQFLGAHASRVYRDHDYLIYRVEDVREP